MNSGTDRELLNRQSCSKIQKKYWMSDLTWQKSKHISSTIRCIGEINTYSLDLTKFLKVLGRCQYGFH